MAEGREAEDRYDRQERIAGWDQEALGRSKVLLVGAGATGNEVLKNLVLLGVGRILVADLDIIETTNLSRTVLFRPGDEGRPKAEVAAERAAALNPDSQVRAVYGDVMQDVGVGAFVLADLVIGCVDNAAARLDMNEICRYAGKPFLDCGIWGWDAGLRVFSGDDDGACFECNATEQDLAERDRRFSCTGLRRDAIAVGHAPTTLTPAALIGALTAQEAARLLCGQNIATGCEYVFEGLGPALHRTTLSRRSDCPRHGTRYNVEQLALDPDSATVGELLTAVRQRWGAKAGVMLTHDVVVALVCRHCRTRESLTRVAKSLSEAMQRCPDCGAVREVEKTYRLEGHLMEGNRKLREMGVQDLDLIGVTTETSSYDVVLTGGRLGCWLTT